MNKTGKNSHESSAPMSKMLPASNIYRVGDYVFVETQPSHPYQIKRIEELTKTANGQVEAKVSCFYRRRDLSNALVSQADKHAISAEEDGEIDMGGDDLNEELQHQMKHRECFLSRQLEIINANTIRGKCSVTLYSEVEQIKDYVLKEDWFYYLLVYDPQQKTLLADRGEICVGDEYQSEIPDVLADSSEDTSDPSNLETPVWIAENSLTDKQVDKYLIISRSIGTFARALDCNSSAKEPSLHLTAAAASRDITTLHAMQILHKNNYSIGQAITGLIPEEGPILCRDEMEEWSAGEAMLFEDAMKKYGKDFGDIQQDVLPWKSIPSLIEYYYMWKTTDKYVQQKRQKASEGDSKVTQIFIPSSNTAINLTLAIQGSGHYQASASGQLTVQNYICESCHGRDTTLWYPWGPSTSQYKLYLCKDCWVYWKKYGGLKKSSKASDTTTGTETMYKCRICNKKFNRAERLSSHMATHKAYKCTVVGCGKTYDLKAHLSRHLAIMHSIYPEAKKLKVKKPFVMTCPPLLCLYRILCKDVIRVKHYARVPFDDVNMTDIRSTFIELYNPETAKEILDKPRKLKPKKTLDEIVVIAKKAQKLVGNVQKPHMLSTSSLKDTSGLSGSGAASSTHRKLMSPIKSMSDPLQQTSPSITANLKTRSVKTTAPSLTTQKRPLDTTAEQNGVENSDIPSSKRPMMTSATGGARKNFDCIYCGKSLHNQASLSAHIHVHHSNSTGPSHIHHPVTTRQPRTHADAPAASTQHRPIANSTEPYHHGNERNSLPQQHQPASPSALSHRSSNSQSPLTNGTASHRGTAPDSAVESNTGKPATSAKEHVLKYGHIPPQRRLPSKSAIEYTGKDDNGHFVEPPHEFVFRSVKQSRASRKRLPRRVQRKLARRPFVQIRCSVELRDAIMCCKTGLSGGNLKQPIVIED